ncbi:MAG: YggT family protein [Candidatus Omnitrophota bacterium]
MFVAGNFFEALAVVIGVLIEILWWLIIIRALLSWVNPDPSSPIVQFIERTTEPVLSPFRRLIPTHRLGIDLSPIAALLFLYFLKVFLIQTLLGIALRLK